MKADVDAICYENDSTENGYQDEAHRLIDGCHDAHGVNADTAVFALPPVLLKTLMLTPGGCTLSCLAR